MKNIIKILIEFATILKCNKFYKEFYRGFEN